MPKIIDPTLPILPLLGQGAIVMGTMEVQSAYLLGFVHFE